MTTIEIKSRLEELDAILSGYTDVKDVCPLKLAIIHKELGQLGAELHKWKYEMNITEFHKYNILSKDLRNICNQIENGAIIYYKAIKDATKDIVSGETYLEIVRTAKMKINRK